MVLEGEFELLYAFLHFGDVDQAAVEVGVDLQQLLEGVPVVDQQVEERACEFDAQHYVLPQRFAQEAADELVLPRQRSLLEPPVVWVGQQLLLPVFDEPPACWIKGASE